MEQANQAKQAIAKLNEYKLKFKRGEIDYDTFKDLAKFHIDTYNNYAKQMARKSNVPFKKISVVGFLR